MKQHLFAVCVLLSHHMLRYMVYSNVKHVHANVGWRRTMLACKAQRLKTPGQNQRSRVELLTEMATMNGEASFQNFMEKFQPDKPVRAKVLTTRSHCWRPLCECRLIRQIHVNPEMEKVCSAAQFVLEKQPLCLPSCVVTHTGHAIQRGKNLQLMKASLLPPSHDPGLFPF